MPLDTVKQALAQVLEEQSSQTVVHINFTGDLAQLARLLKPEIALGWRFNMPADTEAELTAIRQKYMPTGAQ